MPRSSSLFSMKFSGILCSKIFAYGSRNSLFGVLYSTYCIGGPRLKVSQSRARVYGSRLLGMAAAETDRLSPTNPSVLSTSCRFLLKQALLTGF